MFEVPPVLGPSENINNKEKNDMSLQRYFTNLLTILYENTTYFCLTGIILSCRLP